MNIGVSMKAFTILMLLFGFNSYAWIYVPGAEKCTQFISTNTIWTNSFTARTNSTGDWMIVCRGEPQMFQDVQTGNTPYPYWSAHTIRGARGAGARGENLNPGECAWPDRGMGATEGYILTIEKLCNPVVYQVPVIQPNGAPHSNEAVWVGVKVTNGPLSFLYNSNKRFGVHVRRINDNSWQAVIGNGSPIIELR